MQASISERDRSLDVDGARPPTLVFAAGSRGPIIINPQECPKHGGFSMPIMQTRRRFLSTLSLAGAVNLVQASQSLGAEGPLETTTVRLVSDRSICIAPLLVADELLRAEGFSEVHFVDMPWSGAQRLLPS